MRIGIVTITDYSNFGNRLQCYALCRVLKERFGCDAVSLERGSSGWAADVKAAVYRLPVLRNLLDPNAVRWANFRAWCRKDIPVLSFDVHQPLPESLNGEYDLFLAGSDQIWNYEFASKRLDDYFLTFAEPDKRAAMAGSFGVEEIPDEWKQVYIDGLSGFRHISVREDAGKRIIKELLGRDVPVLLDPVMLLSREEWLKVAKKPRVDISKPYILKYYLGDEEEEDKIDRWAEENGYAVYGLMNDKLPELYSAGPGEFLTLIDNAALVCSDSFHCVGFSILFRRPFVVYERQGKGSDMTSRLDTLLGKLGFGNRWAHLLPPERYLNCDFSCVDVILDVERRNATAFLEGIIRG